MSMALNLRGMDKQLVAELKAEAALKGLPLWEYVQAILRARNGEAITVQRRGRPRKTTKEKVVVVEKKKVVEVEKPQLGPVCAHGVGKGYNCWMCGGLAKV